ncbi:unnamed protein product, partial [Oppiella nova]
MIFLEFTRDRVPCNELAQILDQCGYTDKATLLRLYNTSEKPMTYKYEYLEVIKANVLRSAPVLTNSYEMIARPRGIALIVLNDPVLASEAKVFANIFKQLDFVVPDIEQTTVDPELSKRYKMANKDDELANVDKAW